MTVESNGWQVENIQYVVEAFLVKVTPTEEQHEVFRRQPWNALSRALGTTLRFDFPPHEIHIDLRVAFAVLLLRPLLQPSFCFLCLFFFIMSLIGSATLGDATPSVFSSSKSTTNPSSALVARRATHTSRKEYRRHPREECPRVASLLLMMAP